MNTIATCLISAFSVKRWIASIAAVILLAAPRLEADRLTILQTCDLHSHIAAWLRLAPVIRDKRRLAGAENFLLIDCGDTISGTVVAEISNGLAAVEMLKELDYDVWVPGNHEFDHGAAVFRKCLAEFGADRTLAANLAVGDSDWGKPAAWRIVERGGSRVAIIGMTSPYLDNWFWARDSAPEVIGLDAALSAVIPEVMDAKPDLIILAIHHGEYVPGRLGGVDLCGIIAKYPQIRLVLGGHSHIEVPGRQTGNGTWFVEAGKHGECAAEIIVRHRDGKILSVSSHLLDPASEAEALSNESLRRWLDDAAEFSEVEIASLDKKYRAPDDESAESFSRLQAAAMLDATEADAAFHADWPPRAELSGALDYRDVFNAAPYEDRIQTIKLTAGELSLIMAEQSNRPPGEYCLKAWRRRDASSHESIAAAFADYDLAGAGGRFPVLRGIAAGKKDAAAEGPKVRNALRKFLTESGAERALPDPLPFDDSRLPSIQLRTSGQ